MSCVKRVVGMCVSFGGSCVGEAETDNGIWHRVSDVFAIRIGEHGVCERCCFWRREKFLVICECLRWLTYCFVCGLIDGSVSYRIGDQEKLDHEGFAGEMA